MKKKETNKKDLESLFIKGLKNQLSIRKLSVRKTMDTSPGSPGGPGAGKPEKGGIPSSTRS